MSSTSSPTIGEFFLILSEMGFTEQQIQAAVQAGHLSVTEAAEWLLQSQYPRHTLVKQTSKSSETALSAFNPPKDAASSSTLPASPGDSRAGSSLVLKLSESTSQSPDPPPVESRIKQDKSDFEEKERQRVAQKVLAEKRQKKQEREMVLKRIAEDRKTLQEKSHGGSAADTAPPSSEGQKLGGKVQTNVDNNCILMIRLPSGESMRERFSADAPLRSVVEHISGRHPSLSPFSLLQGFPRKRFGEAELACSLRSLGLTPNAALCIQTTPPETPQDPPSPADPPPAPPNEPLPCIFPLPLPHVPIPEEAERLNPAAGHQLPDDLTLPGRHTVTDGGLGFLCRLTLLSELDLKDYTQVTDQGVSQLAAMTRLKKLSLSNTQVTDAGLLSLRGLQELQELCLDRTAVTSRGVAELITCLPQLQVLGLASTHVGDSVVRKGLIHCHQLLKINLSHTRITDQGLKHLKDMRLAQVNLDSTGVSLMGIANLLSLTNIGSVRATNTRTIPLDAVSDED